MPLLHQVVGVLEELYPLRYAEQWDAPGLIVGDPFDAVHRIAFATDPTLAVVEQAVEKDCDLLICHHPLFFRAVHEVNGYGVHGRIVTMLARAHCALWVGHTNADSAYRGVGQAAADAFGLIRQHPLVPIEDPEAGHEVGLGRVGALPEPVTLRDFSRTVADALPHTEYGIQVAGDPEASVRSVCVLPGSGDSLFDGARRSGADVYVTSDLRHHPATDALERARYEARLRGHGLAVGLGDPHPRPMLINTPHSAIESLWLDYAMEDVPRAVLKATGEEVDRPRRIVVNTDPWAWSLR